ncbi:DUF3048 domain-containing protein [Candidatus Saccharibacteria bacterium TM7i]|nr:DUF3048 domain-containing protein [Candidatus Saccharibacteria bacterium TM7i]
MLKRRNKQPRVIIEDDTNQKDFKKPNWFKRHKKWTIVIIVASVLIIAGGTVTALYLANKKPETPQVAKPAAKPKPSIKYYSPLTGAELKDKAATKQPTTAVMIENSPDARPQSGLKDSGVVFEAIAEGGITRFLALYQEQKPTLVGPVRSLRMYYVDWLAPFNASVAHVGGSAAALSEVRNGNYRDIDQFFNAGTYWRATDRYAPHNVYTNFERLDALNNSKGYKESTFTGFARKDSKASEAPTATQVKVTISGPLYNSSYAFNATTGTYDRSQAGAAHMDRESGQISPRVVIVMKVKQQHVMEDGWREQINAVGTGAGYIFQDGTAQEVTWNKSARDQQIVFTDAEGKEIKLARGQTWLTAVPEGQGNVTWQ